MYAISDNKHSKRCDLREIGSTNAIHNGMYYNLSAWIISGVPSGCLAFARSNANWLGRMLIHTHPIRIVYNIKRISIDAMPKKSIWMERASLYCWIVFEFTIKMEFCLCYTSRNNKTMTLKCCVPRYLICSYFFCLTANKRKPTHKHKHGHNSSRIFRLFMAVHGWFLC